MRRTQIIVWVSLLMLLVCGTASAAQNASQGDKIVVRIGHKWGETNKWTAAFKRVEEAFEAKYPHIDVQVESGWANDKFKVGVVAGNAPEVFVLDNAPSWAVGGFLHPLNQLAEKFGVRREDFIPAAWDQHVWLGELYALPAQVDPNFGLIWNKTIFQEVGLDPDRAPRTVQEFDEYFDRLTAFAPDGTPIRMGMTPWTIYGSANTIYTWGWLHGGEFYDYEAGKTTAHHPGVVEALEYLTDYFQRYGGVYDALRDGIPAGMSRFTSGREAMALMTPSGAFLTIQNFPNIEFGLTTMFNNPDSGVQNATWIGGWAIGMKQNTEHPEEAFQLMQFITSDPEGVEAYARDAFWLTANFRMPYFRSLGTDPQWGPFAEIVTSTTRYRPAIPGRDTYDRKLSELFPQIIRRQITPSGAMEEISRIVDAAVAEAMAQ